MTPDAATIGTFIIVAIFLLGGAEKIKNLFSRSRVEQVAVSSPVPSPLMVQHAPQYADAAGVRDLAKRMEEGDRRIEAECERKIVAMHGRVATLATAVDHATGALEQMRLTMEANNDLITKMLGTLARKS